MAFKVQGLELKIATWNVNSLRVRLSQVLDWLRITQPDVLALQETKLPDADFPLLELQAAGYQCVFSGQRAYNGVAFLSRHKLLDCVFDLPLLDDPARRVLGATLNDVRLLNLYVPNGQAVGSDKYQYKLTWLHHLYSFLEEEIKRYSKIVILGDFNIAPEEGDVYDPALWRGKVLFSEPERQAFSKILTYGFQDCFRLHTSNDKMYTWWDYRIPNGFKRNLGLRIDHILATSTLNCEACHIDKTPRANERPSDHAPVIALFEDSKFNLI